MELKNWIKNHRSTIIGVICAIALLIGLPVLKDTIYYMRSVKDYRIGRIYYKGRLYIKGTNQVMDENMKKNFNATKPTGKYIFGNEVYDIPNNPYHSTVIFLRGGKDGRFQIYGLSGGP